MSKHTPHAFNRSTQKGKEVFAKKLLSDDEDNLVLYSPIDDDKVTLKSSSHTSFTRKENYTNVPEKVRKRLASVQVLQQYFTYRGQTFTSIIMILLIYQSTSQLSNL